MKKFILMALTVLLTTGIVMADKKCCKDSKKCAKTECANKKSETKACCAKNVAAGKKACCANSTTADATKTSCAGVTGKKACCKDKAKAEASANDATDVKINDDGTVAEQLPAVLNKLGVSTFC